MKLQVISTLEDSDMSEMVVERLHSPPWAQAKFSFFSDVVEIQ